MAVDRFLQIKKPALALEYHLQQRFPTCEVLDGLSLPLVDYKTSLKIVD